jgi:hypothetical protein
MKSARQTVTASSWLPSVSPKLTKHSFMEAVKMNALSIRINSGIRTTHFQLPSIKEFYILFHEKT